MRTIRNNILRIGRYLGLLLALCLTLAPTSVEAGGGIGAWEVRAAVETWVRHVTADARPDAVIERMEPYKVKGETVAYIAHLEGGGFCLCGADVLVLPVYFYSPRGAYDPENPNYQYILWEIDTRLKYLRKGLEERAPRVLQYQGPLSEREAFWEDLIAGRIPRRVQRLKAPPGAGAPPVQMELNLTSRWHQGSGNPGSGRFNTFNAMCPILTPNIDPIKPLPDEHTIVGCVATAMAQIMYYWKWPNTGVSNASVDYNYRWGQDGELLSNDPGIPAGWPWDNRLLWTAADGGTLWMNGYWDGSLYRDAQDITNAPAYQTALKDLWDNLTPETTNYSATFGAATYNWSIMQDPQAVSGSASNAEMAKLSHHAGVAVGMTYGILASSAGHIESAVEDHFRYDPDATYGNRDIDAITEEIQWLRPTWLRGEDYQPDGGYRGHAWVVYGYNKGTDPDRQFLMNMGWGGYGDGWYSCDHIDYNNDNDIDFWANQKHVTYIAPLNVVKFVGATSGAFDGSPGDPYRNIREAITNAPDGATLIFKAGSVNTFSEAALTINRPFTLKGQDVTIRKEELQ